MMMLRLIGLLFLVGCSSSMVTRDTEPPQPRSCAIFDGESGEALNWSSLMERVNRADAVMLGERHDDLMGHLVQQAVLEDAPLSSGLALEMLERDEQPLLDDFRDGLIDQTTFQKLTESTNWAGAESWQTFYQPAIDVVLGRGGPVVAANAPRRYVRHARIKGEASLPTDQPRSLWFDLPSNVDDALYRKKFFDLMGENTDPTIGDQFFLAQRIWDASMGKSLADLRASGAQPAILLVGGFHVVDQGGTVLEYTHHRPSDVLLIVSLVPEQKTNLPQELLGTADIIILTGSRDEVDQ
ncbi:MAG: ChaN family lipoprotein [Planctomycetota bacterium]|nr:ChaN family lipoprotein [Planctomycetota bacterium]